MTMRSTALLLLLCASPAWAQFALEDFAQTSCGRGEPLFRSGMEGDEAAGVRASGGKSGGRAGPLSIQVTVPDTGRSHSALLHVPSGYDESRAWPLVIALHGTAQSPPTAAAQIRSLWAPQADAEGALLLAPIASGNSGGWAPDFDTPALACALAEVERRFDVDRARRYLWGFSSGAHYGHALALANSTRFAAYAVNAGALYAFACGQPGTGIDCATLLPGAARRIPVQLRVGTNDPLRPYTEGDELRFEAAGWSAPDELRSSYFVGGHGVSASDIGWAWSWFEGRSLPD